ncbi:MAG: hemolysin family protein [Akkermansiaceae bacterium]
MNLLFLNPLTLLGSSNVPTSWPTWGESGLYVLGVILFVALNAIFVAVEFALLKIRLSQAESLVEEHPKKAARIVAALGNLNSYLSACQLGITIASLILGRLGEPFVMKLVGPIMHSLPWDLSDQFMHTVSWLLATLSFSAVHVVIGEQVPKVLAIRKPTETCLRYINFLHFFYVIFGKAVNMLNSISNWILLKMFKVEPAGHEEVHSAEEIAQLVEMSEKHDEVTETEREILINALELNDVLVKDVMTNRRDVIVLDADDSIERTIEIAAETKHTRFPLVKGHFDNTIGLIHIKDFFKIINDDQPDLMSIKRTLKVVPETMPLDVLLKFFQKEHEQLALVVDEHGDSSGLVFMDNVIEELVGDIQDEFDNETSAFTRVNDSEFVVEGSLTLNELSDHEPNLNIVSSDVTTVGGYITKECGSIPAVGEAIEMEGYEARVTSTDGRRVGQVHFTKLVPELEGEEELAEVIVEAKL